ncbi:MAG: hypothetical protein KF705_06915 [Phycisphaeraceae bacterium]|nr:hypothetical protein [Phycisphaeraceae bacterium]
MTGSLGPRSVRQDIVTLVALCAVVLFVGLTTHGLSNWQESMRALVARDMGVMGEWVVPRVNGEAYLAKPPMVYWCQLAIARVRGVFGGDGVPGVFELRLTVALAAMLGVVATYVVTRGGCWVRRGDAREKSGGGGAEISWHRTRRGGVRSFSGRGFCM